MNSLEVYDWKNELENDPDNPCLECGQDNPIGLRLRFFKDGDLVSAHGTRSSRITIRRGKVKSMAA